MEPDPKLSVFATLLHSIVVFIYYYITVMNQIVNYLLTSYKKAVIAPSQDLKQSKRS